MSEFLNSFILSFIPIFVAIDAIANIPIYLSIVSGFSEKSKKKIVTDSVATATTVAIVFMFLGKGILLLLGITIPDFQIAGGLLLFVIAVHLLMPGAQKNVLTSSHDKDVGIFPLGTPLITGPAVLATTLIVLDTYGIFVTAVSLLSNMLVVWLTLAHAERIMKFIGPSGIRAFAKFMYILLAAIAVMMVRRGIMGAFFK